MHKYCSEDQSCIYRDFFQNPKSYQQQGNGYAGNFGIPPYIGVANQRGYGIGSFIAGLGKSLFNLAKPVVKSLAKSATREIVKRGKDAGINIMKNVLEGQNPKEVLKKEAKRQMKDLRRDALGFVEDKLSTRISSGKRKGKVTKGKSKRKKVREEKDIFDR